MNIPNTPHERNSHSDANFAHTDNHTISSVNLSNISTTEHHRWIKFSKLGETCPICDGAHKRCATNGQLVICAEDWQIPGWNNKGQDKAGIGYLYAPDRHQESEYKKLSTTKKIDPPKSTALTPQELDKLFNELLRSQPVESWAEADLKRRGIKPAGLLGKSFPKGIVDERYKDLPGTYRDSMGSLRFNVHTDSYFCPIFNGDGLVIGGQLKVRDGKYIWLSAGSKGGINHHINGKSPHTFCNFRDDKRVKYIDSKGNARKNVILFAEGVLKPSVINQLSGHPTIGAVGGNFKGNFDAIERFIAKASNDNPDQFTFVLAADAESGLNHLVLANYKTLSDFVWQKYKKQLYVVWYGKYTKQELNFDDVLATKNSEYRLILFDSFIKRNQEYQKLNNSKKNTDNIKILERYLPVNNDYWGDRKNATTNFTRRFNAGNRSVLAIKFSIKTGKIEALKLVFYLSKNSVFVAGYRNSLLKQTGNIIPAIYHRSELVSDLQISGPGESVSLCVDSLLKISFEAVENKILIFDEAPLVFGHLLTSETCKGKRHKLLEHLECLLSSCVGIILMSDQLTDFEVKLIQELAVIRDKDTISVENTYRMPQRTITEYDNEDIFEQSLHDAIKFGKKVFIQTDSQAFTNKWERKILQEINPNLRVLTINSETLYKGEVSEFLASPNELLHLYDVVICSPTAESGLSIDVRGYFDAIYVYWCHLGLDACEQMMHRYRDENCPVHLFAYSAKDTEVTEDDIKAEVSKLPFDLYDNCLSDFRVETKGIIATAEHYK